MIPSVVLLLVASLPFLPQRPSAVERRAAEARQAELTRQLQEPWPDARRRAVAALAELGTRDAWLEVIASLGDDEPEVADEAQLALARLEDERLRDRLLGRGGLRGTDEWVRRRVAEAQGRMRPAPDLHELARLCDGRQAWTCRRLLWSIERQALAGATVDPRHAGRTAAALERCAGRGSAPGVRAAALSALAALAPSFPERARTALEDALDDREREVRVAALDALGRIDPQRARDGALRALVDVEPAVRLAAIECLGRHANRVALEALIERLPLEQDPRPARRLVAVLQGATGMRYRADPRPWALWLARQPADWLPAPGDGRGAASSSPAASATAATFVGLPLVSRRIAFLIDCSGSLWRERAGGVTRKSIVDDKLAAALESLPPDTQFNLIPYTGEPLPWKDELQRASRLQVAQAARWFERFNASGRGNVFDAVLLALEDPRVDTLVILTDGAPTGGPHWNLELIVELLLEELRYKRVAVDAIVVDAPPRLFRPWQRLAQESGGRALAVEFPEEAGADE